MSSSNRASKEISNERPSQTTDRQSTAAAESCSPCQCKDPSSFLSIYTVRFPANICEHQSPNFVWQPSPPPGRGGGSIVAPTEKTSPRSAKKSPRKEAAESIRVLPEEVSVGAQEVTTSAVELDVAQESKMSASEVKIIKRETKNR